MDELGITSEDRKRIRQFLEKPPYKRTAQDLVPDTGASVDTAHGETSDATGSASADQERIRAFLNELPCHRTVDDLVSDCNIHPDETNE